MCICIFGILLQYTLMMQWGEGAGGGWFRLALGKDALNIESHRCSWAVPAQADIARAMQQFDDSA